MTSEKQFTSEEWRLLTKAAGPCITMVIRHNAAELRDALRQVREGLMGMNADIPSLLAPLQELSFPGKEGVYGQVVVLRAPGVMHLIRLPGGVTPVIMTPVVKVAERFDLRTLLLLGRALTRFSIVALSEKRSRILECTQFSMRELPFPAGIAASLEESRQSSQPDHVLDNRSSGGPSMGGMKGVLFGTSTDREKRDEYLLHFLMGIDRAVNAVLKGSDTALVPVGVEHELSTYRRVNTYPHLVDSGVHGSPDGLEESEMHRQAAALVRDMPEQHAAGLLAHFDKNRGTGHASADLRQIALAAAEGRVAHLFLQESAFDAAAQGKAVESAARGTLEHGGETHLLPAPGMPGGSAVCALFRYAGPKTAQAGSGGEAAD